MDCSPGLEDVSGMWRNTRYSLGTLPGALESLRFYYTGAADLCTSQLCLDLSFIINRTLGEKFLCSRYAQCNNFLPGSYINLLPLSELLCLPPSLLIPILIQPPNSTVQNIPFLHLLLGLLGFLPKEEGGGGESGRKR